MNTQRLRMKTSKKGVTPVIATIILIAGTLVLALVVGAYTFGLFGSNVKTVTLASATLYGGIAAYQAGLATSSITFSLNNPGSASTITSITLTGTGLGAPITGWSTTSSTASSVNFAANAGPNSMLPGQVTSFTFYPTSTTSAQSITTG